MLVNAGGRVFETTALTLKTCGAGYFEALLGDTGAKLPGRKRARVSADGDDAPGGGQREIFIDRDPDRFADVLSFMRTSCLPSAVEEDLHRLRDLRVEAEFLAYDALLDACDKALVAARKCKVKPWRNIGLGHLLAEQMLEESGFYVVPADKGGGYRSGQTKWKRGE